MIARAPWETAPPHPHPIPTPPGGGGAGSGQHTGRERADCTARDGHHPRLVRPPADMSLARPQLALRASPPSCRSELEWRQVALVQQPSGQAHVGRVARLPDEPHRAGAVHALNWVVRGCTHSYRMRQRLGWDHLRRVLVQVGAAPTCTWRRARRATGADARLPPPRTPVRTAPSLRCTCAPRGARSTSSARGRCGVLPRAREQSQSSPHAWPRVLPSPPPPHHWHTPHAGAGPRPPALPHHRLFHAVQLGAAGRHCPGRRPAQDARDRAGPVHAL